MINKKLNLFLCICGFLFVNNLLSCNSVPVNHTFKESWSIPEKNKKKHAKTISLLGVSVDRPGGWDSLEKEISALAPLYLWEQGYKQAAYGKTPDYFAHVSMREREINFGWKTRCSLAMEVRIWSCDQNENIDYLTDKMPLAAGRIVSVGKKSFSSSQTTGKMLSRSIAMTVRKIP